MLLLPLAIAISGIARAAPPEPTGGLYGGQYFFQGEAPAWSAGARLGIRAIRAFDLELELGFAQGSGDTDPWQMWSPRLSALYHITPDNRFDLFFLAGTGAGVRTSQFASTTELLMSGGLGFTLHLVGPLHLRADGRWVGGFGETTRSDFTWDAGIDLRPELPPDIDGDGLKNRLDGCPEQAEDLDQFEDDDGCPDSDNDGDGLRDRDDRCDNDKEDYDSFDDDDGCPDPDNDEDGLADRRDKCPNNAEDKDGYQDEDGCPDKDNDNDNLADRKDQCPDQSEDLDGFQDDDGCPDLDNDEDGTADPDDACPDHPEDMDGFQDDDGCPDKDDDDDLVPDDRDACPQQPEVYNGITDDDGCPDEIPPEVKRFNGVIKGITFETGKAVIRTSSEYVLFEALYVFQTYPGLYLEIQGHTDSKGDDAANLALSQARADAVRQWFLDHGVEPERILAIGYGETAPIADNRTEAGRTENRRVEFRILDTTPESEQPREVEEPVNP